METNVYQGDCLDIDLKIQDGQKASLPSSRTKSVRDGITEEIKKIEARKVELEKALKNFDLENLVKYADEAKGKDLEALLEILEKQKSASSNAEKRKRSNATATLEDKSKIEKKEKHNKEKAKLEVKRLEEEKKEKKS